MRLIHSIQNRQTASPLMRKKDTEIRTRLMAEVNGASWLDIC